MMAADHWSKEYSDESLLHAIVSSAAIAGLVFSRRVSIDFQMVTKYSLKAAYRYSLFSLCIYILEVFFIMGDFYKRQDSLKLIFLRLLPTFALFETFFVTDFGDEMEDDDSDDEDDTDDDSQSDDSDCESEMIGGGYNNENMDRQLPFGFVAGFLEEEEVEPNDDFEIEDDHLDKVYAKLIYKVLTCS